MTKEFEMENNKIGSAIQYFRETYQISQSKLCRGLCSVATFSRIEAGERDVDSLLLEALLERLGKTPNQFEIILSDVDYILYQNREEVKRQINNKNSETAQGLLIEYEKSAASKGSVHMQFIMNYRALLNELFGGTVEDTVELLKDAISCTVPDFMTSRIKDYYLSNSELNIIIDIIKRLISVGMIEKAKEILDQVLEYLGEHKLMEENNRLYPKVAVIASQLYIQEKNYQRALEMCNKGLEMNKGSRKMDFLGELFLIKAQAIEQILKANNEWISGHQECLQLYLQAYYIFDFCEEHFTALKIKKHLEEEYQWEGID